MHKHTCEHMHMAGTRVMYTYVDMCLHVHGYVVPEHTCTCTHTSNVSTGRGEWGGCSRPSDKNAGVQGTAGQVVVARAWSALGSPGA